MLQALFIGTALHFERDLQIIVDAADGVYQLFDCGHGYRIVVVYGDAAQHPGGGLADLLEGRVSRRKSAAAIQRGVELINAGNAGDFGIGIPGQGDEIRGIFVKIDREHNHYVRVGGGQAVLSGPGFTLLGIVHAHQQDVDDVLHHGQVRLLLQRGIGVDGRRGRGIVRAGRGRGGKVLRKNRFILEEGRGVVHERAQVEKRAAKQQDQSGQHANQNKLNPAAPFCAALRLVKKNQIAGQQFLNAGVSGFGPRQGRVAGLRDLVRPVIADGFTALCSIHTHHPSFQRE